ncbi:winged helix-turn-helix domain-containing protein [Kineosporia sp. R_H_3]|uniref:winged helix-turn-helix domain-containing protein n=1 Tax=Kineosporia sp. R_H_3 TaxID=1961848 RepID=UPI001E5DB07A|nr:winged helix-turn-helix domain-containing protein [Kineosporia sp. R_H_3]
MTVLPAGAVLAPARSLRAGDPAPGVLTVVPPDEVPAGAAVVGVVVLLPARPDRPADLRAVPDEVPAPPEPAVPVPDASHAPDVSGTATGAVPAPAHEWVRPGLTLDRAGRSVTLDAEPLDLTRREFDLFAHLASRPGRVLTREHLLATVWGHADPRWTGPRTVDVHVARLRRKLGGHGRPLQTVRGVGYRWVP